MSNMDNVTIKFIKNRQKSLTSPNYNYLFDMYNGNMMEWGKTEDDDPNWCPYGPTILDIEVTSICDGGCSFCYKSNTTDGHNMSIDTFKTVLDKFPKTDNGNHILTQVAFGADSKAESNPDLFKMMDYTRAVGLIPNITVANITEDVAKKLVGVCGAVAVSAYKHMDNYEACYRSISRLTDEVFRQKLKMSRLEFETFCAKNKLDPVREFREHGMQLNIHYFLSEETSLDALDVMDAIATRDDLKYVNAIVFLHLKQKGRGAGYTVITKEKYDNIVKCALADNVNIGFDTCGAGKFKNYIDEYKPNGYEKMKSYIESCCAGRFSCYVNEYGDYFPCSFMENTDFEWASGISVVNCVDFIKDIWYDERVKCFGKSALECCNNNSGCPYWDV